jgi:hypothetical protein
VETQILEKLGCFKWCLQAYNCQIRTVSGGEVAASRDHSEARIATPGLGRSTSPSGEAAGEGANHRLDKSPVGRELAQGTTIAPLPLRNQCSATCQASHHRIGSQRLPCAWAADRVDWLWGIPIVDASVSCQRARRRIRLQKVHIVPHCTTIWHRMCTI